MLKSKQQVDKHVQSILGTIREDKERHSKGFQIAKLYLEIKEYDTAKKYCNLFLAQRENFAPAHRLLGQILESQGLVDKAVNAYKKSLQLDDSQKDILVRLCELYSQLDVDPETAKYWAERVEKVYPNHQVSFRLRERALEGMRGDLSSNSGGLEDLLCTELTKRPQDPVLRTKLVRLFIDTERVNEAYEHVMEVEKRVLFTQSREWYQCILDVLQEYKRESGQNVNGTYHQMLLHTLNTLTSLTIEHGKTTEVMDVLYQFDQTLHLVESLGLRGDVWNVLYREMQAQFYSHTASLLLKKAVQGRLAWREASDLASVCYLVSSTYKPPSKTAVWYGTAPEADRPLLDYWCEVANQRACQTGHMMRNIGGMDGEDWIQRIQESYCTDAGKDRLFSTVFTQASMKDSRGTSYLVQNPTFTIIAPEMPRDKKLKEFDAAWCNLRASELHHVVWMCLQNYDVTRDHIQPDYELNLFDGLQHGVLNLDTATLESLCILDMEVFVYACVHATAQRLEDKRRNTLSEPGQIALLPVLLCAPLVTDQQAEWWVSGWKVYTNTAKEQLGRLRLTLQRGLETVRLVGNHGMSVSLVVHLARTFEARTEDARAHSSSVLDFANEIASLQARALGFWKAAVDMAEKQLRGTSGHPPKHRLFDTASTPAGGDADLVLWLAEGRFYVARVDMAEGRTEQALQGLDAVATPEAAYYQGQLYKKLAQEELGSQVLDQTGGDERNKQIALLTKSRDKFYLTLDRLRGDKSHPLNADLADEIDDVESRLARVEADIVPRDLSLHDDEVEESCIPSDMKGGGGFLGRRPPFVASTPRRNLTMDMSTRSVSSKLGSVMGPPVHTRPSPERLEAQMKQFTHTQDTVVTTLLEELKDRRKTLQLSQEKVISLEHSHVSLTERLYTAERDRDAAVLRLDMETSRLTDDRQRFDDERRRHESREGDAQKKMREAERLQDKLEYEKQRLADDRQRVTEDRDRLKEQTAKLTGEWKSLEESRRKLDQDRRAFEEEKRLEFEQQKERLRKEEVERVDRVEREQAQRHATALLPDMYNPAAAAFRPFPPGAGGYDLPGQFPGAGMHPPPPQYGAYPGQYPPHPALVGMHGGGFPRYPGVVQPMPHTPQRAAAANYQVEDDFYYEEDDDENGNEANGQTEAQGNPYLLPGASPVIPPLYPGATHPIPGPGFFSPDKSAPAVNQPPAVPAAVQALAAATGAQSLGTLLASQAQGAALFTQPGGTKYPMSMPPATTTTTTVSAAATSTAGQAASISVAGHAASISAGVPPPQQPASTVPTFSFAVKSPAAGAIAVVAQKSVEEDHNTSTGNDSYTEPHFEPIVSLPEVDVVTGEEEEVCLVECRAKLHRFVDKVWKERGLGQIRILHDPQTEKVRVVMRREQIHKVCANHYLRPDMTISLREGCKDNNVLTWRALDFTGEVSTMEQFCCRFKTAESAQEFKDNFEKGIEIVKKSEEKEAVSETTPSGKSEAKTDVTQVEEADAATAAATPDSTTTTTAPPDSRRSLGEMFRPATGSWDCNGCYLNNVAETIECVACQTAKPGHEKEVEEKQAQRSKGGGADKFGGAGSFTAPPAFGGSATSAGFTPSTGGGFAFGSFGGFGGGGSGMGSKTGSTSSISSMGSFTLGAGQKSAADSSTGDANSNVSAPPAMGGMRFGSFGGTASSAAAEDSTVVKPSVFSSLNVTSSTSTKESVPSNLVTSLPKPNIKDLEAAENKNSFGGLTFTTKPVITAGEQKKPAETSKEEKSTKDSTKQPEVKAANPFAAFSFASQSSSGAAVFGQVGGMSPATSFSSLTKEGATTADPSSGAAFKPAADFQGFQGTGKQLFGTPVKSFIKSPGKAEGAEEDYEPDVDFKPVIELPQVTDLKTGEEDETALFCERSKMYRWDPLTKSWKERGIGEIKLLKHIQHVKYRCIMRREQVLKLCANHALRADMKMAPHESSEKTYTWHAQDYSEEELKEEYLAAKFKTQEIADHFKEVFESCVSALHEAPDVPTVVEEQTCSIRSDENRSTPDIVSSAQSLSDMFRLKPDIVSSAQSLSDMFRLKPGEWECGACYVKNPTGTVRCMSCESPKPGCEAEAEAAAQAATVTQPSAAQTSAFKFGGPTTGGFSSNLFQSPAMFGSPSTAGGTPQKTSPNPPLFGGFQFKQTEASPSSSFTFGGSPSSSSIDTMQKTESSSESAAATTKPAPVPLSFGAKNFNFAGLTPIKGGAGGGDVKSSSPCVVKSPGGIKSPIKSPGGNEYYNDDGEGDDIHFEPVVTLPDDYEHHTGEEEEEALYTHRAKLFRWGGDQWKERGVGDIKVLRHRDTGKYRLLMRREVVLKICLNHQLIPDLELKPMANAKGKAWVWFAEDFSENEQKHEQFAIRFRSQELADQFKSVFDDAKEGKLTEMVTPVESEPDKKSPVKAADSSTKKKTEVFVPSTPPKTDTPKTFLDSFSFTPQSSPAAAIATATPKFDRHKFTFSAGAFGSPSVAASTGGYNFGAMAASQPAAGTVSAVAGQSLLADLLTSDDLDAGKDSHDDDVIFLGEKNPTPDQEERARLHLLPRTFYLHEASDFPACRGCIGCDPDAFDFGTIGQAAVAEGQDDDVVFLYEERSSPSKQQLIDKYQLPANFYNYEQCEGCEGCPGCEGDNGDNEEALIATAVAMMGGNPDITGASTTHLSPEDELVVAAQAFVTGGQGNPYYAAQLDEAGPQADIKPQVAHVTGDRGNVHYTQELEVAGDDQISSSTASVTGDRGNIHYSKELDKADSTTTTAAPVFGSTVFGSSASGSNLFGGGFTPSTGAGIFGGSGSGSNSAPPSGLFGSGTGTPAAGLFGSGSSVPQGGLFGAGGGGSMFGGGNNNSGEGAAIVFGGSNQGGGFDFAALAQQTPQQSDGTVFGKKKEDSGPFQWQGAGATLFSPSKEGGEGGEPGEDGADIHFEPIVQLPEVEVKTGEEDETAIYAQRSKLYRFDKNTDAWKEKAVGEMKILRHNETGVYRLLMRREQVYKIACNHLISTDLKLTPMLTSETSWCWHAMDYSGAEPRMEQLAIRFKTKELAEAFVVEFTKCQQEVVASENRNQSGANQNNSNQPDSTTAAAVPSQSESPSSHLRDVQSALEVAPDSTTEGAQTVTSSGDYDDDEDYEDEDQGVMFTKRATMFYQEENNTFVSQGVGEIQMLMDDDVVGYRVRMETDDEQTVCNHIICRRHAVQKSERKKFVEWTAKDFSTDDPIRRTFKVQFSSASAVKEFESIFKQGVALASESEIDEVHDSASLTGELLLTDTHNS